MAIIKLKRLSMVALKSDRERLMDVLQDIGCVQIVEMPEVLREEGYAPVELRGELAEIDERIALLNSAMGSLKRHAEIKKGLFAQPPEADERRVREVTDRTDRLLADCGRILDDEAVLADIRQKVIRLEAQNAQIEPLSSVRVPLDEIADTGATVVQLGTIAQTQLQNLKDSIAGNELIDVVEVGRQAEAAYVIAVAHKTAQEEFSQLLAQSGFSRLTLRINGTVRDQIAANETEISALNKEREKTISEIKSYADRVGEFELLLDLFSLERDRLEAAAMLASTESAMHLTGWIPQNATEKLDNALLKENLLTVVEYTDPEEGDEVPTCVRNNNFFTPYEFVTNMFSSPSNNDIDPTPQMMPFFVMFFGIMLGDAAYGLIIAIGALAATLILKMRGTIGQIAKILIVGGLATAFWGFMFGAWFGIEGIKPPLLSPMEQPLEMLGLCFGLGALHLFYGMIVRAYMGFKQGDWQTAVFDEFTWIFLILGLVAMLAGPMLGIEWLGSVATVVVIVSLLGILLFAGRDKKWGIGRIISGLGALYGITSYLSDILSYARLFAMGLATGVICLVFNTIAGLMIGSPIGTFFGIIVLLIGHTFNLAINALGSFVHSCRLQYIEFFGKFYEGGGRLFSPLVKDTKFVTLKK